MTFSRFIGIDYSGAETPTSSLKGLRIFSAGRVGEPREVPPPPSPRRYWTRRGVAHWLVEQLRGPELTIVGIDHGFSFPKPYFARHSIASDWDAFLDDFAEHWPTDQEHMYVDFIRDEIRGNGAARQGDRKWRRLTEVATGGAKSVFHFDVQGQVAKSTHAGIPWLRFIRRELGASVHFWPFDGFDVPPDRSMIVEVYPRLWNRELVLEGFTDDQRDAFVIARAMRDAAASGLLDRWLAPDLSATDREVARYEGWILGVEHAAPAATRPAKRKAPTPVVDYVYLPMHDVVVTRSHGDDGPRAQLEFDFKAGGATLTIHFAERKSKHDVSDEMLATLRELLSSVRAPVFPQSGISALSGSTSLQCRNGMNTSSYCWLMSAPKGWESMNAIVDECFHIARQCSPEYY
jgi:hypothetical protein